MRVAAAVDHAMRAQKQSQPQKEQLTLCAHAGCTRPQWSGLTLCHYHSGVCGFQDCGQWREEDTDTCIRHQPCSHPECGRLALFICGLGQGRNGEVVYRRATRFCEEHKACGARMVVPEDGSGSSNDIVVECQAPISKIEMACQEHQCAVAGCKDRREPGLNGQNQHCHVRKSSSILSRLPCPGASGDSTVWHHSKLTHERQLDTCRAAGCREATLHSAAGRRRRFCETHTCAEPTCSAKAYPQHGLCSAHLREGSPRSSGTHSSGTHSSGATSGEELFRQFLANRSHRSSMLPDISAEYVPGVRRRGRGFDDFGNRRPSYRHRDRESEDNSSAAELVKRLSELCANWETMQHRRGYGRRGTRATEGTSSAGSPTSKGV